MMRPQLLILFVFILKLAQSVPSNDIVECSEAALNAEKLCASTVKLKPENLPAGEGMNAPFVVEYLWSLRSEILKNKSGAADIIKREKDRAINPADGPDGIPDEATISFLKAGPAAVEDVESFMKRVDKFIEDNKPGDNVVCCKAIKEMSRFIACRCLLKQDDARLKLKEHTLDFAKSVMTTNVVLQKHCDGISGGLVTDPEELDGLKTVCDRVLNTGTPENQTKS